MYISLFMLSVHFQPNSGKSQQLFPHGKEHPLFHMLCSNSRLWFRISSFIFLYKVTYFLKFRSLFSNKSGF